MFGTHVILRKPKVSEMALSTQVKNAIEDAKENLRDALAFAARAEHPITINTISDILICLDSLESIDIIMQKIGNPQG